MDPKKAHLTIIPLGRTLLNGSSHLPARTGSAVSAEALARLFGVAPSGVYLASLVTNAAGVSYTSGSPLPVEVSFPSAVCFLLHFPSLSALLPRPMAPGR